MVGELPTTEVAGFYRRAAAISLFLLNQIDTMTATVDTVVKQATHLLQSIKTCRLTHD